MEPAFGAWEPLSLTEVRAAFADAPFRWWITGGHALELFVGRSWRAHDDMDVSLVRADVAQLHAVLRGWDLHVAAGGVLSPFTGSALSAGRHENNVWCRRSPRAPWCLDLTVSEGDAEHWIFRRDSRLRLPWTTAVLTSADGMSHLAPELQLLFNSRDPGPKDEIDAAVVIPLLSSAAVELLAAWLGPAHPWQSLLR